MTAGPVCGSKYAGLTSHKVAEGVDGAVMPLDSGKVRSNLYESLESKRRSVHKQQASAGKTTDPDALVDHEPFGYLVVEAWAQLPRRAQRQKARDGIIVDCTSTVQRQDLIKVNNARRRRRFHGSDSMRRINKTQLSCDRLNTRVSDSSKADKVCTHG